MGCKLTQKTCFIIRHTPFYPILSHNVIIIYKKFIFFNPIFYFFFKNEGNMHKQPPAILKTCFGDVFNYIYLAIKKK